MGGSVLSFQPATRPDWCCSAPIATTRLHRLTSNIRENTMVSASRLIALAALVTSASPWLNPTGAQNTAIPPSEYAARRDSLAARIGDGVVVALGGRTPVTDFGPFYQLPGFNYLTNF